MFQRTTLACAWWKASATASRVNSGGLAVSGSSAASTFALTASTAA
jgi:hypothetical protein